MEEATEETEAAAAAAAAARRPRYAHLLIVYELQFEHSARWSAPQLSDTAECSASELQEEPTTSRAPRPGSRMSQGW